MPEPGFRTDFSVSCYKYECYWHIKEKQDGLFSLTLPKEQINLSIDNHLKNKNEKESI
jgi:hypothetical protein